MRARVKTICNACAYMKGLCRKIEEFIFYNNERDFSIYTIPYNVYITTGIGSRLSSTLSVNNKYLRQYKHFQCTAHATVSDGCKTTKRYHKNKFQIFTSFDFFPSFFFTRFMNFQSCSIYNAFTFAFAGNATHTLCIQ